MNEVLPYKRDTGNRLILLRIYFIVGALVMTHAFTTGIKNLGYFLAVVILACLPITIIRLFIDENVFEIKKYYFFGLIPVKSTIKRENIVKVSLYTVAYQTDGNPASADSVWDLLWVLQPGPRITMQRCRIEYIDWYGEQQTIRVSLTLKEYEMIKPGEDDSFPDEQPVA